MFVCAGSSYHFMNAVLNQLTRKSTFCVRSTTLMENMSRPTSFIRLIILIFYLLMESYLFLIVIVIAILILWFIQLLSSGLF